MTEADKLVLEFAAWHDVFTLVEAYQHCQAFSNDEKTQIRKRLCVLVGRGKLVRKGHGIYALSDKAVFRPQVGSDVKELYEVSPCITPLMHHMASNQTIYVDVEKDASEFVFDHLRSDGVKAYYKPDEDMIYRYVNLDERNVFVKNLVS